MIPKYLLRTPCIFGKYVQSNSAVILSPTVYLQNTSDQIRYIAKHWNPAYKKERRAKVIKVDLPNFQRTDDEMTPERRRSIMKEHGLLPQKQWLERPIFISCTSSAFESYVAPEGDGRFSTISKEGAKQRITDIQMKGKSMLTIRKIKTFDETFSLADFPEQALNTYIKAHEALAAKDTEALREYVTEVAYARMLHNTMDKIIRWKYLESLEPPRVVHARHTQVISKDNIFAQMTVRFHSQQMLCIYDRFGRLYKGSEILRKDVLEYVVFENHLANQYGTWRMHIKIIPPWMPPREVGDKTYVLEPETNEVETSEVPVKSTSDNNVKEINTN